MKAFKTDPVTKAEIVVWYQAISNYQPKGAISVYAKAARTFDFVNELVEEVMGDIPGGGQTVIDLDLTDKGVEATTDGILLDGDIKSTLKQAMEAMATQGLWKTRAAKDVTSAYDKMRDSKEVKVRADDGDETETNEAAESVTPVETPEGVAAS